MRLRGPDFASQAEDMMGSILRSRRQLGAARTILQAGSSEAPLTLLARVLLEPRTEALRSVFRRPTVKIIEMGVITLIKNT